MVCCLKCHPPTNVASIDRHLIGFFFFLSSFQKNRSTPGYSQVIVSFLSDEQFGSVCRSPHGALKVVRSNHVAPACRLLMFWHQQQFEHSHQPQVLAWKCLIIHNVTTEDLICNATLFIPGLYAACRTLERECQLLELLCPLRAAVWRSACYVMRLVSLCVWSASHWAAESLTNCLMSAPVRLVLSWSPNKSFSARSVSLQVCGSARLCCSFPRRASSVIHHPPSPLRCRLTYFLMWWLAVWRLCALAVGFHPALTFIFVLLLPPSFISA